MQISFIYFSMVCVSSFSDTGLVSGFSSSSDTGSVSAPDTGVVRVQCAALAHGAAAAALPHTHTPHTLHSSQNLETASLSHTNAQGWQAICGTPLSESALVLLSICPHICVCSYICVGTPLYASALVLLYMCPHIYMRVLI